MTTTQIIILVAVAVLLVAGLALWWWRARRSDTPTQISSADVVVAPEKELTPAPSEPAARALDKPEPPKGRLAKLRSRLATSGSPLGTQLLKILSRDQLTADDWDELEELLLLADIGIEPATALVEALQIKARVEGISDPEQVREALRAELIKLVDADLNRDLNYQADGKPAVVLVVGVKGSGKTTTVGKIARILVA